MRDEERKGILVVVKAIEWVGTINVEPYCPMCGERKLTGHSPSCELVALIKKLEEDNKQF